MHIVLGWLRSMYGTGCHWCMITKAIWGKLQTHSWSNKPHTRTWYPCIYTCIRAAYICGILYGLKWLNPLFPLSSWTSSCGGYYSQISEQYKRESRSLNKLIFVSQRETHEPPHEPEIGATSKVKSKLEVVWPQLLQRRGKKSWAKAKISRRQGTEQACWSLFPLLLLGAGEHANSTPQPARSSDW